MHFTIEPRGEFELSRSIGFLEAWSAGQPAADDGALRFAFCSEADWRPVAVRVTQTGQRVEVEATRPGLGDQVARILSLDVDGTAVDEIAGRDPVVARLVRSAPGLRPVCFWTPWEAACWAVLSQRTSRRTASALKQRIGREHGTVVSIDGRELTAFPGPQAVLDAPTLPGVNPVKLERLHGLAVAALAGTLTATALRAVPAGEALATLQELPGVGPFSAALILIRGAGAPDVFPSVEPRLAAALTQVYGAPDGGFVEGWRPLRSWVSFWLRAAAPETLDEIAAGR